MGWALNASVATVQGAFDGVSSLTEVLRSAFPDSGAYLNEADYEEPAWQTSFWGGVNYLRLQAIKLVYDPTEALTCNHCVVLARCASAGAAEHRGHVLRRIGDSHQLEC